jgi:hypothetical protein
MSYRYLNITTHTAEPVCKRTARTYARSVLHLDPPRYNFWSI